MNIKDIHEPEDMGRLYLGEVTDNNDPEMLQRVRVRVPNRLDYDVSPWVAPIAVSPFGVGAGYSTCRVPAVGSSVIVMFQGNQLYYGLMVGYPQTKSNPLPSALSTNYPKRYGFVDPVGNTFFVDMTDGQKSVEFHHASGALHLTVEDSGACTLASTQSVTVTTSSTATVTAGGGATVNAETTVNGNVTINGNTTISGDTTIGGNTVVAGATTSAGPVSSAASVAAPSIVAATALSVGGLDMTIHRHYVSDGSTSTTGTPSI